MTDEHALADFIRNRAVTLYRYGYLLTGNHHDAEDLVQDALIRLRAHWSLVARKDDPIAYVRTIMARRVDATDDAERVWAAIFN